MQNYLLVVRSIKCIEDISMDNLSIVENFLIPPCNEENSMPKHLQSLNAQLGQCLIILIAHFFLESSGIVNFSTFDLFDMCLFQSEILMTLVFI